MPERPDQRKERVGRMRFLSDQAEAAALLWFKTVGDTDMHDAVTVLIDTGLRRGELLNLRPVDMDMKTGVAMIYGDEETGTNNVKFRSVPLTQRCKAILSKRMHGNACFDITKGHMRHSWEKTRDDLGLLEDKDFVLHCCRHTCASRLVKAGVSLSVVMTWTGHSSIQTTMRYAHLYPTDLLNAVKTLENS